MLHSPAALSFSRFLLLCLAYFLLLVILLIVGNALLWPENLLQTANLTQADANHYEWISIHGYGAKGNIAFFPLYPLVWRLLGSGEILGCLVNVLLFSGGLYVLAREYGFLSKEALLFLAIPSGIFFFLPFSESFFFVGSVLILLGLKKDRNDWLFIGFLLSSLARPAFVVFVPALLLTEWLSRKPDRKMLLRLTWSLLAMALGFVLVGLIQYMDTGEWFQFFSVQSQWDNRLRIPELPLGTWGGPAVILLDGPALLIGAVLGVSLLRTILKRITSGAPLSEKGRDHLFAALYLCGISLMVLLWRGGLLFSLNRFFFSSAFFVLILWYFLRSEQKFNRRQILLSFLGLEVFFLLCGSYIHLSLIIKFSLLSLAILVFVLTKVKNEQVSRIFFWIGFGLFALAQAFYFLLYLSGEWVA